MIPRLLSLFSGVAPPIVTPIEYAAFCEASDYPREVLRLRYPDVPCFGDVRTLDGSRFAGVDGVIGGFPCQDLSGANPDGKGLEGERSGLWFEMLRVARESRPRFVVAENVSRLQRMGLDVVAAGLEGLGYVVEATRIAASDVGAPHERMRLIIVAHRDVTGTPWPIDESGGTWARITGRHGRQMVPRWRGDVEQAGLWPTPTVKGNYNRAGLTATSGDGLAAAVAMWPTPRASDDRRAGTSIARQGALGHSLSVEVREPRNWPTPVASDYKGSTGPGLRRGTLPEAVGVEHHAFGPLNPDWTEALMGWPIGWTDLGCRSPAVAPDFPMGRGPDQHSWEPPRMVEPRTVPSRGPRIKACGNGWVPSVIDVGIRRALSMLH